MNMTKKVKADGRATLFDVLDTQRVGMLGVVGSNQNMQPMTHHADANAGALWFVTSKDTDLVRAVGTGARGVEAPT
jgi:general stress protein 26